MKYLDELSTTADDGVDRCFEDAVKQAPQRCFMIQYNHNSDEFDRDMALVTALGLFRPPKKSPEEAVEKSDGGPEGLNS